MDTILAAIIVLFLTSTFELLKKRYGKRDHLSRASILLEVESKIRDRDDDELSHYADAALSEAKAALKVHNQEPRWWTSYIKAWLLVSFLWMVFNSTGILHTYLLNVLTNPGYDIDTWSSIVAVVILVAYIFLASALAPFVIDYFKVAFGGIDVAFDRILGHIKSWRHGKNTGDS